VISVWGELKRRNVVKVAVAYAIVGWLLIEIASTVLPTFEAPRWALQTLTFVFVLGFPIALIFAWAYELTPEGLKKEKDIDRSESITQVTGRKLDFIIIAVLVLAVVFFGFDKFVLEPSRDAELVQATTEAVTKQTDNAETTDKSIAVMAFADLSPEGDQEYFSDGVSEEILNDLARIPDLHVTSRSSAFSFKGKGVDIPTVAKQLGVANVLEGSVRKSGKRIRITAQLIDARNGFHLWSETYDRELEDIFAVQDEISSAIVMALKEHLGLEVKAAPRVITAANTEAHEAYLRGRHLVVQSTPAATEEAIREFKRALSHDPDYALAHAELAIATVFLIRNPSEAVARAAPHVERAMALDPTLAEAHAATGALLWRQLKLEDALTHLRHAVQINPNYVIVYVWMGNLLNFDLGRYEEAFQMRATAMRLDPLSIPTVVYYLQALIERHRLAEADRELEKIASIFPHVYAYRRGTRTSLGGNMANAVLGSLDALRINPEYLRVKVGLPYHLAALGLEKEALAIREQPQPFILSYLGKPRDAITVAEARVAEDPNSLAARANLGLALAGAGDYARARPILEEMWRRTGGRISKRSDLFHTASAAALIAIRRDAGEEAEVGELVAAILDNVRRYRKAGIVGDGRSFGADYEEGLASYLSGDRERGLVLLDKGMEDGVFMPPNEAYLQAIYDDPGFAPILARQEARQVRERDKILAIVCTANPYEAVWQPAEGTCERFAAASGN
jgi:TolB-like protein/tetratricopeptide (TPR) repeat protein